ncbi:MAG: PKD domain-containing protein [Paludibacteraceae bacterium]|nr:PKD domain-containing protein [Paludibacteraceae bacterium]
MVTLKGYSKSNDYATKSTTIQVLAPVCKAGFSYQKADDGVTVTFTNKSENAVRYLWDFGDKTTSTDKNPVHKYNVAGGETKIFTVTLTAYPQSGNESSTIVIIAIVNQNLEPTIDDISWTPTTPNVNELVIFSYPCFILASTTDKHPCSTGNRQLVRIGRI